MLKKIKTKLASAAIKNWRHYFLQGNNVKCPVCQKAFITFLPMGNPMRFNAECPYCRSMERTRLTWLYLLNINNFFSSPKKILHIAPEKALFKKFIENSKFTYYPIDKFTEGYTYPKRTVDMDLTNLAFGDNFFDFFLCSHVLEHIPDDKKAMQELYRILKPGGFGIVMVPLGKNLKKTYEDLSITNPKEREKHFGQFDHVRLYGLDIEERLRGVGFEVIVEKEFINKFTEDEKKSYSLTSEDLIFKVKKNLFSLIDATQLQ